MCAVCVCFVCLRDECIKLSSLLGAFVCALCVFARAASPLCWTTLRSSVHNQQLQCSLQASRRRKQIASTTMFPTTSRPKLACAEPLRIRPQHKRVAGKSQLPTSNTVSSSPARRRDRSSCQSQASLRSAGCKEEHLLREHRLHVSEEPVDIG